MPLPRRHGPVATSGDVLAGIRAIRRRRLTATILLLTLAPAFLTVDYLVPSEEAARIFAGLWLAAGLAAYFRATLSPCPRCGLLFYTGVMSFDLWVRRCVHCKLDVLKGHCLTELTCSTRNLSENWDQRTIS